LHYDNGVKNKTLWPVVLILVFAFSRWPGAMPQNFSAAYALCFCAGLYLPRKLAWALPLGVVLITDLFLTFGYYHLAGYTLANFLRDQAAVGWNSRRDPLLFDLQHGGLAHQRGVRKDADRVGPGVDRG
jgi:hypothetical protein